MNAFSSIEALEPRIAPAGLVKATFAAGILTLVGDGASNNVTVQAAGVDHFQIVGLAGTSISLNGAPAVAVAVLSTPVSRVAANLGGGDDTLALMSVSAAHGYSIQGGDGSDTVTITSPFTAGPVAFNGGDGADVFTMVGTEAKLSSISLNMGAGGDTVSISPSVLQVSGLTSILGGPDDDNLAINSTQAHLSATTINGGAGANACSINTPDGFFGGNLTVVNGAHPAGVTSLAVTAMNFRVTGNFTATYVDDASSFNMNVANVATIGGNLSVTTGSATDSVGLNCARSLTVGGTTALVLGGGTNGFSFVGGDFTTHAFSFTGGSGNDGVTVLSAAFHVPGATKLVLGAGTNNAVFNGPDIRLSGNVTIAGGAGDDSVAITGPIVSIGGSLTSALADGANTLTLGNGAILHIGKTVTASSGDHVAGISSVSLFASSVELTGSVNMTFGDGVNSGVVSASNGLFVAGNVSGHASDTGFDTWSVTSTAVLEIGGAVSFHAGNDGSSMTVNGVAGSVGSVAASGGSGADNVFLTMAGTVRGSVNLSLGTGSSNVTIDGSVSPAGLHLVGPLLLTTHSTAAQADSLGLIALSLAQPATIALGDGASAVNIQDSIFGAFSMNTGGGVDNVSVDTLNVGIVSTFKGPVEFHLGSGADNITIGGGLPLAKVDFRSTVLIDGGAGADTFVNLGNIYKPGQPVVVNL